MNARLPIILTSIVFVGGLGFFYLKSLNAAKQPLITEKTASQKADTSVVKPLADITLGDEKAPHTLVTYFAPCCPHCAHYEKDSFPSIDEKFIKTGKIKAIFRVIPIAGPDFMIARLCYASKEPLKNLFLFLQNQNKWLEPVFLKGEEREKALESYRSQVCEKIGLPLEKFKEQFKKETENNPDTSFLILFALENSFSLEEIKKATEDDQAFDNSLAMNSVFYKRKNGAEIGEVPFFSLDGFDMEGIVTVETLEEQLRMLK